ncbi:FAD-dependent oxidoreductase [Dactylosporangium sp. CA-092794]|uniref:FAD-dependent oxidoreductase n=1 Tax=Dactylosporangium sp. CA-092794 TaxID=3239929 RepID=UPI003D8E03B1
MTRLAYCRHMPQPRPVLVIGAGVSGMTSAIRLAESGYPVEIISREPPHRSTSCSAGALWGPYLADDDRVIRWSERTRVVLESLAEPGALTGVRCLLGLEAAREPAPVPEWARGLKGFREATAEELGEFSNGWWYEAPIVDMPVYLKYLQGRLADLGVPIRGGEIDRFDPDLAAGRIIVNCTGLGAGPLTGDDTLLPVRGQLVVVPNPGLDRFFAEHDETPEPTYLLPHGDLLVLGGSIEDGVGDPVVDMRVAEAIQRRCALIDPRVGGLRPIEHRVGVRPGRPAIRLEHERTADGVDVVHNYGHGGAGVTASWGCAEEVAAVVRALDG